MLSDVFHNGQRVGGVSLGIWGKGYDGGTKPLQGLDYFLYFGFTQHTVIRTRESKGITPLRHKIELGIVRNREEVVILVGLLFNDANNLLVSLQRILPDPQIHFR